MDIELNRIAIWCKIGATTLSKRTAPIGTSYRDGDSPVYKTAQQPIVRYAKDYAVDEVEFCLFVRTFCKDDEKVEKFLDNIATKITKDVATKALQKALDGTFMYLDAYLKEEN